MKVDMDVVKATEARVPAPVGGNGAHPRIATERFLGGDADDAPATRGATFVRRIQRRSAHLQFGGATPSATEQERILGTNDLVDEFYLQRALIAARPVCRVTTRGLGGRVNGYATGFMVSPSLLLTNWHVFKTKESAAVGSIEFDYTLAIDGSLIESVEFSLQPDRFFASGEELDFALVAVAPVSKHDKIPLARYGYHRLVGDSEKIARGESITIIQHPGGGRRQFSIRENQLKEITPEFLLYASDTAQGSSGAPALNDSFQVVALHHSGRAARDGALYVLRDGSRVNTLDGVDDSKVVWEINEGIRTSVLCDHFRTRLPARHPLVRELHGSMEGSADVITQAIAGRDGARSETRESLEAAPAASSGTCSQITIHSSEGLAIPLMIQVTLGSSAPAAAPAMPATAMPSPSNQLGAASFERMVQPEIDTEYSSRTGYDPKFLGIAIPLPRPTDLSIVSKLENGDHVIPYEHFSIVLNRKRRLALFCASNVDGGDDKRRPEPDGDYTRKGLTGLGKNDQEEWVTDPRIPEQDQLPDRFYNKDRQAFDKGHLVRREDMAWGDDFAQVRRANNDTYHTTNCSPQVSTFNQSAKGGTWGQLENEILKQAKDHRDRYTLFTGPILDESDRWFDGKDDRGDVRVQIPRRFWKVVVTVTGSRVQAFGFVLEQILKKVKFQEAFQVSEEWETSLYSLTDLQDEIGVVFPSNVLEADQYDGGGQEIAKVLGATRRPRKLKQAPKSNGSRATPAARL